MLKDVQVEVGHRCVGEKARHAVFWQDHRESVLYEQLFNILKHLKKIHTFVWTT